MRSEVQTVLERCREIGLDATQASGTRETISAHNKKSARELPRISIDLSATLSRPNRPPREVEVERDLEVISTLGEGGMGRVLLARQHSLDREVAIKTLRSEASEREHAALVSEGAITGHLEHPSIIPVHALGLDGEGHPVLVMKRVEGVEWTELLANPEHTLFRDDKRERLVAHLEILKQVLSAVEFAHSKKIVHRDIKPQNILIGRYGDVYLGDWGLAVRIDRPWSPQPLCGTPAYMAPEMVVGGEVDARTDVYLLGATLHHILTGEGRNQGHSACDALVGAIDGKPYEYPPTVPPQLAAIANRACARDPAARYQSALEVKRAIAKYLDHRSSIALGDSALERLKELRALVEKADLSDEKTQDEIDRLAVEARFALLEALKQWEENSAAQRGLDELDQLLAARRARAAELERLAKDLDPKQGAGWRTVGIAAVALIGATLSALALFGREDITPRHLFYQSLAPLGGVILFSILLRRRLFGTAFNRRGIAAIAVLVGAISVSRALDLYAGVKVAQMLAHDLLVGTVAGLLCALFLFRWVGFAAVITFSGALAIVLQPARAMQIFSISTGLALLLVAWLSYRFMRR